MWSGEQTNLHPVALVPITEDNTMALRNWIKEPGTSAIQFHIGAAFKEVLKCVHTVLFLLDYVPFQIDAGKKKAEMHLKGEWCREMEMELEERVLRSKSGPLFAIRKSVRDVIVANMKAFRAIVGPEIATEFLVPFTGNQGCTIAQEATKKLAERSMQLNI